MTSIDRAFHKAYEKKLPEEMKPAEQTPAAVWIDETTGDAFRPDVAAAIPQPHFNRSDNENNPQAIATAVDLPPSVASIAYADPPHETTRQPTANPTAYDAWKDKLKELEIHPKPDQRPQVTKESLPTFMAAWEVDQFAIPVIVHEILSDHLSPIGRQLDRATREGLQTLAICSQFRNTGRSTVSIAVAQGAADAGLRVALVDGDVDAPNLVDQLQLEVSTDWVDSVSNQESIEEVTIQSLSNKFCFVPLLKKSPEQLRRIDQQVDVLLDQLRLHFDLIIVDFGPLNEAKFGLSIPLNGDRVDAVMMVEDMRKTDRETLESFARRIRALGIDNIGLIENFTSDASALPS